MNSVIDMCVDHEAQSLSKHKKSAWQCNVNSNNAAEYLKFWAAAEPFYLHSPFPIWLKLVLVTQMHS